MKYCISYFAEFLFFTLAFLVVKGFNYNKKTFQIIDLVFSSRVQRRIAYWKKGSGAGAV